MVKRWVPLEANPDVLNRFAAKLGADASKVAFCDVYGLDEELLTFVPQPVYALLLLFPVTAEIDAANAVVDQERAAKGETADPDVFYTQQTIGNACGTIGVLHALGNNVRAAGIGEGSFLQRFIAATAGMSPAQRGAFLEDPPEGSSLDIEELHKEAAQEGDSRPPDVMEVTPHFVALVNHRGRLLELDGRKKLPVDHGQTSQETLLQDAARVARQFMDKTESIHFNLMALTAPAGEG